MLGEKVVIFVADFNEPRDLYRQLINEELPYFWTGTIDGRTPTDLRHHLLEEFSNHQGSAALLINPLVGGQGLDIVAANHVFHMNPAWNPAKTDQATFRVTRPGQTRQTWSHHLYYAFTVEEAIYNLVLDKRELSDAALEVAEAESQKASKSVLDLFEK
jgi:SNF2 family DNA or RNA helicase